MFFGKRSYENPERGFPPALKRQLVILIGVLVGVVILSLQILSVGKRYDVVVPKQLDPQSGFGGAPVVPPIGTPLEPQPPQPFVEDAALLSSAEQKDRTDGFDEAVITYLIQKIRTEGDALYKAVPRLSMDRGDSVWEELLRTPSKYRGALVEVKGEVVSSEPGTLPLRLRGLQYPNPSGLDRAFQSYLVTRERQGKIYLVATVRKQRELSHRDPVRIRGYFCQLYTNDVEYRGEIVKGTVPFLVCDDYELLERPTTGSSDAAKYLPLLGILGAVAVAVVLLSQRSARHTRDARRHDARRWAARPGQAVEPAPSEAPASGEAPADGKLPGQEG